MAKNKDDDEKQGNPYALKEIFIEMELDLIQSFRRNLIKHRLDENKAGFSWEMWQVALLRNIEHYRKENSDIINGYRPSVKAAVDEVLNYRYEQGTENVENTATHAGIEADIGKKDISSDSLSLPEDGKNTSKPGSTPPPEKNFFGMNKKKLDALIKSITADMEDVAQAVYRKMDDVYRQTIFKTEMQLASGAVSLDKAIDLAAEDFLAQGLDCIVYKNGRHVNIATYAEMALRTASQRATFLGEGAKRDEYKQHLIMVSAHANCCKLCLPWQGQILIDDVFSHPSDEYLVEYKDKYKLLSTAIKAGLLHPNCRHTLATYFEGISRLPTMPDEKPALESYNAEQKQRSLENAIRKAKRQAVGAVDIENEQIAMKEVKKLQKELRNFLEEHPEFKRQERREKIYEKNKISSRLNAKEKEAIIKYISPDSYKLNDKLRNGSELTKSEQRWVDNLDSALSKMPVYEGVVTRSLEFMYKEDITTFVNSHVVGNSKKYSQYLSTTNGTLYNEDAHVQITIHSKKGRDVRFYNQEEQEILFKRDSQFFVTEMNEEKGVYHIVMEEI